MNNDKWNIFFSQSIVCYITGTTPSNVSRYISQHGIKTEKTSINSRQKYSYKTIRKIIKHFGFNEVVPQKKLHVFLNFKGGTGKTSLCYQISYLLHYAVLRC